MDVHCPIYTHVCSGMSATFRMLNKMVTSDGVTPYNAASFSILTICMSDVSWCLIPVLQSRFILTQSRACCYNCIQLSNNAEQGLTYWDTHYQHHVNISDYEEW